MSLGDYFQVLISLGIVAVFLYLFYRFMLSYKHKIYSGDLKVIDRLSLDSGVSVIVLNYKEKQLLLGVSQKDIKILTDLSDT